MLQRAAEDPKADSDAVVHAYALYYAWSYRLPGCTSFAALERLAGPVLEHGPTSAAGVVGYLLALAANAERAYEQAIAVLEEVWERFPEEEKNRALRDDLLAQLLLRVGRVDAANRVVSEAIDRARLRKDPVALEQALATRAQIAFDAGLVDRALLDLDAAREASDGVPSSKRAPASLETRANLLLNLARYDRVLALTEDLDGLSATDAAVLRVYRASALRWVPGRIDEADGLFGELLEVDGLPIELLAHCFYSRVLLALDVGEVELAWQRQRQFEARFPATLARFAAGAADVTDYNVVAVGSRVRVALLEESGAAPADLAAWHELHEAAFRSLLSRWDGMGVREGGSGRFRLDRWRRVVGELALLRRAVLGGSEGDRAAFEVLLDVHARGSLARALEAPRVDLERLRRLLGDDHGLLCFLPSARDCLVFVVDRSQLLCVKIEGYFELLEVSRNLQTELGKRQPSSRELEAHAARLTAGLLGGPVWERISSWRRMTVSGVDFLGDLPLEVLALPAEVHRDDVVTRTLGEAFAVEHCASLSAWATLASRAGSGGRTSFWSTLSPAARVLDTPSARLGADRLTGLRQACAPGEVSIADDAACSVTALLRADLRDVGCLHLICHGAWDDAREIGSFLALSPDPAHPDGAFGAEEVAGLERVPPLVVLSACRAGQGHGRIGDGSFATLAGAFLRRGARCVVFSRGNLALDPHLQLVAAFHAARTRESDLAEALRQGRVALARGIRTPELLRELRVRLEGWGRR